MNIIYILQEESQENLLSVYTGFGMCLSGFVQTSLTGYPNN